jgi:hypothetical protein
MQRENKQPVIESNMYMYTEMIQNKCRILVLIPREPKCAAGGQQVQT